MKKIFIIPCLLFACLSFVAFSPADSTAKYNDLSKSNIETELRTEVGSFTEMYTRSVLSDKSTWSHRHKEFTLTASNSNVLALENSLNRN